jgi:selenide,water dikinase
VHPDRVWAKAGARPGDVLLLSKPIGTGIVLAGGSEAEKTAAIARMQVLNRGAAEALQALDGGPHAVTDVTGFGLFGHGWEMAERSGVSVIVDSGSIPLYAGARAAADRGVRTGGDARNRTYLEGHVTVGTGAGASLEALAYDPQTSGGLLAAVPPAAAPILVDQGFVVIGEVAGGPPSVELR